ncbi:hypothetical protein GOODEAATRI_008797 [Goodea atripinnis]|uniref:Uncharacterized protein n=1 Tax=Goodea atripinnis TaxID=208336 RepID=A0ABV0NWC2_9TELE
MLNSLRYFFGTSGLYFLTVGRLERGGDIRQMSPGPELEPGTAASRTVASVYGRALNPHTISAAAMLNSLNKLLFVHLYSAIVKHHRTRRKQQDLLPLPTRRRKSLQLDS